MKSQKFIIRRVIKVFAGGRRFNFSVFVVVGDGIDRIGVASVKSGEIGDAVKKHQK